MGIYYWVCALQVYWNWPITVECAPCAHSTFGFLLAKFNGMALFRRTILSLCTRRTHGSSHWHVRVFFSSGVSSSSNAVCLSRWFYRRESGDRNLFIVDKYLQFRSMMGREKKYVARRRRRRTHFALYTQNGWSENNSATEAMGRRKKYRDERERKRERAREMARVKELRWSLQLSAHTQNANRKCLRCVSVRMSGCKWKTRSK